MTRFTACALLTTLGTALGCESSHPGADIIEVRAADVEWHEGWIETSRFIGGSKVWMDSRVAVDSSMVASARPAADRYGAFVVLLSLNSEGASALADLTAGQETRSLAVLVDGHVVATPLVFSGLDDEFVIGREDWSARDAASFAGRLNNTASWAQLLEVITREHGLDVPVDVDSDSD